MTNNVDLTCTEHIIIFSEEDWSCGTTHCKEIFDHIRNMFPGHTFVGLPPNSLIKDMTKENIKECIEVLESYLNDESKQL